MADGETPTNPSAEKLFNDTKQMFKELMAEVGVKGESASDILGPEAYTTNMKVAADTGQCYMQFPIFKLNEWAGRDRLWFDAHMFDARQHANQLNALTVSRVANAQVASAITDAGLVAMFLEWFNRLINIDEPSAWLHQILRTDKYGDYILAHTVMFLAKAAWVTLNPETMQQLVDMLKQAKTAA